MLKKLSQLALSLCLAVAMPAFAQTRVVTLGTGTPVTNPDRVGSSTAVIYNDKAYVFDVGPGSVHRMIQAAAKGLPQLHPTRIEKVFLTHLHSDHVLDYPELASTLWWRRENHISVYGPTGLQGMAQGYYDMLKTDLDLRINGIQPVKDPTLYQTAIEEHAQGGWKVVDGDVTIEAFDVPHGDIKPAFGYKITTPDKTVVISGDTGYSEKLIEMAKGADILVHEVINDEALHKVSPAWQKYHSSAHTPASELARVASAANPGLLVLTHLLFYAEPVESTAEQVRAHYNGKVVLANDLDVFE